MKYEFTKRMSNVKASAIREILKATADPDMISFAGGNPAADAFPTDAIEKIFLKMILLVFYNMGLLRVIRD